jgi:hypothetical protein
MSKLYLRMYFIICAIIVLSACQPVQVDHSIITITVLVEGSKQEISLPTGSTVQVALDATALTLGQLDRISPPIYTTLTEDTEIVITRVLEMYETQQWDIHFERQELPNESMPAGESRLIQAGQIGKIEKTIRRIFEDGIESSISVVSETVISSPIPEILMVGVQNPFSTVSIPGRLVYLTGGNAWLMESSTANRRPLVTSGDLDGRVFSLSPDGLWLLFSRISNRPTDQEINSLWVVNVTIQDPQPINLRITNIIHFADWQPGEEYIISYSTVEPRASAPGWQANNDLYLLPFDASEGKAGIPIQVLESSSGGIYGWWGTTFVWSPDGTQLAFSRPDGIGLVDLQNNTLNTVVEITPLNTYADWAWIPGLAWGSDRRTLYFVTHALPSGLASPEESTFFDLQAFSLSTGISATLILATGMFSYPSVSPLRYRDGESSYEVACLQAIFPSQSTTSRYRLLTLDRDGSELQTIFPSETQTGIKPQIHWGAWAPEDTSRLIALLYEGNLWIVDTISGQTQQVTGDGLTKQLDWK